MSDPWAAAGINVKDLLALETALECSRDEVRVLRELAAKMARELEFAADCRSEGREDMTRWRCLAEEFKFKFSK